MEEKKNEICSAIRTIFNSGSIHKSILLPRHSSQNNGFTLIEILIVVAIIGLLAAGFLTIMDPAGQYKKSKDASRISNISQIQTALELYRADCGRYPDSPLGTRLEDNCNGSATVVYMQSVPTFPSNLNFNYAPDSTNRTYNISICLEKNNSSLATGTDANCGSGTNNIYQVSNP